MKKYGVAAALLMIVFLWLPSAAVADETHIRVNIDPRGMSDEVIKMEEHEERMREQERQRLDQERIDASMEAFQVGEVYFEKGDLEEAVYYYETAIRINGANLKAHERLLEVSRLRDDEEMKTGGHYHKAMHYLREGMKDKAVDELILEIREHPDNETARIKLTEIENSPY